MRAAKTGYIAEFVTGYLQREIRLLVTVSGGTDTGLRDSSKTGYAVGRLVHIEGGTLTAATGVTEASIGNATHIIAQSDDTIREDQIAGDPEKYSTLPNLICKNSTSEKKTIAVYKIVDPDDIQIKHLG